VDYTKVCAAESEIIKCFTEKYKLVQGREWFEGDIDEMKQDIVRILTTRYRRGGNDSGDLNLSNRVNQEPDSQGCSDQEKVHQSNSEANTSQILQYVCQRCGYSTEHKHNIIRHLKGKKVCKAILSDKSIAEILQEIRAKEYNEITYNCMYCSRRFNNRSSMYRHIKICQSKKKDNTVIQKLSSKVEALEKNLHDIRRNTLIPPVVNQHINNYGTETIDHLPIDFLTSCFITKDIPNLIKTLHFDHGCPENYNIKLKSLKRKIINVFENNKWVAKPAGNVLDYLINNGQTILTNHYWNNKEDIHANRKVEEVEDVLKWLDDVREHKGKTRRPLKMELIALLENYR
jgi:uncharacterized CHY-type Zn-finger protein